MFLARVLYPQKMTWVGMWDVLLMAVMLGLGLARAAVAGDAAMRRRLMVRKVLVALACLAALEAASRLFLQPPPERPPVQVSDFLQSFDVDRQPGYVRRFVLLDPSQWPAREGPDGRPAREVLHSGNSVVQGPGVPPDRAFAGLLDARDPVLRHRNVGVAGAGPDFGYVLVRNWVDAGRVSGVVFYLHPNNLTYLDVPFEACGRQPLIEYAPQGPVPRCRLLDSGARIVFDAWASPPPFAVAVAMSVSRFLGHVNLAIARLARRDIEYNPPEDQSLEHLRILLTDLDHRLKAAGIPWMVAVLPGRPELEGDADERGLHRRVGTVARQALEPAGVPVADAFDTLQEAVRREGADALFSDRCCHLTERGHAVVADWLEGTLAPLRAASLGGR